MKDQIWNAVRIAALGIGLSLILWSHYRDKTPQKPSTTPTPSVAPTKPRPSTPVSKTCPELAQKVFNIVELAESIFLKLETEDLFRAQSVCHQWKSVIESSPSCRKALFLEPGTPNDVNLGYDISKHNLSSWKPGRLAHAGLTTLSQVPGGVVFNPLLIYSLFTGGTTTHRTTAEGSKLHRNLLKVCLSQNNASCRRMYITQPPLEFVTVSVWIDRGTDDQRKYEMMIDEERKCWITRDSWREWQRPLSQPQHLGHGKTLGDMADSLQAKLLLADDAVGDSLQNEWEFVWSKAERNEVVSWGRRLHPFASVW